MADILLEVNGLKKYFKTKKGPLHAVDDVSFKIERGKTLGVVGESGCGKTTTGRTILRLLEPTGGEVLFEGKNVFGYSESELRHARKDMQIIFQDPYSSLNPRKTVGEIIGRPLKLNKIYVGARKQEERILEIMDIVGLDERFFNTYPHELDGGRRQRIGIARALSLEPKFIVCDEPVSALDVSIQAQILNLLADLQKKFGITYIFITHDLSVVKYFANDIAVMYLGHLVEKASSQALFKNPRHPYTQALLSAIPTPDIDTVINRILLKGELTSPINPKPGCRFAPRCIHAVDECTSKTPELREVAPGHFVACVLA